MHETHSVRRIKVPGDLPSLQCPILKSQVSGSKPSQLHSPWKRPWFQKCIYQSYLLKLTTWHRNLLRPLTVSSSYFARDPPLLMSSLPEFWRSCVPASTPRFPPVFMLTQSGPDLLRCICVDVMSPCRINSFLQNMLMAGPGLAGSSCSSLDSPNLQPGVSSVCSHPSMWLHLRSLTGTQTGSEIMYNRSHRQRHSYIYTIKILTLKQYNVTEVISK